MKPTKERPGYKKTKSGWIPEEWEIVKLGDVSKIIGGGTPSTKESSFWKNGTIYWATPTDFTKRKGNYITETDLKVTKKAIDESNINILNIGSVIMSSRATIGECKINLTQLTINQGFASFECGKSLFNIFLLYLIKFLKKEIIRKSSGSTFLEISKSSLRSFEIPLPPFLVQQKIAEILSTVDEKIEAIDTHIQENEKLKKELMNQLLTKGIGHTEFRNTKMGKIPKNWEIKKCEALCNRITDGEHFTPTFLDNGIPLVSAKDIEWEGVNFEEVKYVSEINYLRMAKRCNPEQGDVLIVSRGASIGRTTYNNSSNKFALMGSVILLKPNSKIISGIYLAQYLKNPRHKKYLLNLSGSSAQQAIYLKDIKKTNVLLPPLQEQKKIAEILGTVDEKIEVLREEKEAYQTLKKGLMQKLLTGEIRVNPST